jgi:tryptophan synthase alpha chain
MVLLSYYNPVLQYGVQRFCTESARSGVDGLVVPDLPPDEADDLITSARPAGLDTIFLLAPTSTDARIRLAAARSTGFIYCVSVTGVTGVRDRVPEELHGLVRRIKIQSQLPVCVGFGVSTPQQARQIAGVADGVIVGSALVSLAEEPQDRLLRLEQFVRDLREALDALPAREA